MLDGYTMEQSIELIAAEAGRNLSANKGEKKKIDRKYYRESQYKVKLDPDCLEDIIASSSFKTMQLNWYRKITKRVSGTAIVAINRLSKGARQGWHVVKSLLDENSTKEGGTFARKLTTEVMNFLNLDGSTFDDITNLGEKMKDEIIEIETLLTIVEKSDIARCRDDERSCKVRRNRDVAYPGYREPV